MVDRCVLEPSWPDLVFHVFAHVAVPGWVPASLFDPAYVTWVAHQLGPLSDRPLGEDRGTMAELFADHRRLAHVQWLAALFDDLETARAAGTLGLSELAGEHGARPELAGEHGARPELAGEHGARPEVAAMLLRDPVAAELAWASALLELPAYLRLPPAEFALAPWVEQLAQVAAAAPHLAACELAHARALGRRGRVIEERIYVGLPDDPALTAWQAAHEATVAEVRGPLRSGEWNGHRPLGQALGERELEAVALVLLSERSRVAGLRAEHRYWRDAFAIDPDHCLPSALTPAQRARFDMLWG